MKLTNIEKQKIYWNSRQNFDKSFLKYESKQLNRNAKLFDKVILEASNILKSFYLDYGHDSVVTYTDAIQVIKNRPEFAKRLKEALTEAEGTKDFTYLNFLKDLEQRKKISRLDALAFEMNKSAHELGEELNMSANEYLSGSYERSYKAQTTALNALTNKGLKGALYQTRIQKAIFADYNGKSFSTRIWQNKDSMTSTLRSTLQNMFLRQQHISNAVEEMTKRFNVNKSDAERLIRTEGARITEEATRQAYAEHDITKYQFDAALDERTSTICKELNGKIFNLSEAQTGVNYPPMHPNCRSTTLPVFD